jgi:hypothetical protein
MTRIAGASFLLAVFAAAGCGVGNDGPGMTMPPQPNPVSNAEVCTASFTVTGTFTPGTPGRPLDPDTNLPITGCWPVGTWTFTAAVDSTATQEHPCQTAPTTLATYAFKVTRVPVDPNDPASDDTMQQIDSMTTMPAGMQYHLSVSSNGQGCQGHFEVGSADGSQYWNMVPTLAKDPATTTIAGNGDYIVYQGNGWPWAM